MTSKNVIELLAMLILLGFSAFFSATETAMTSLSSFKVRQLEKKGAENAGLLRKLTDDMQNVITSILVGNNIANIVMTTIATIFFTDLFGSKGAVLSSVIVTLVILIFGEVTPKLTAQIEPEGQALKSAGPLRVIMIILKPLVLALGLITNSIVKNLLPDSYDGEERVTEEDIKTIVDVSEEQGVINNDESEIINNVFDIGQTDVADIMTPRPNMETICVDVSKEELLDALREIKHSRIPVFGESIDNIVGVLHVKDLANRLLEEREIDLEKIARPTFFVYENMNILDLFNSMKKMNVSLAVVVDEYGGTSGVVTIEDIVEELVGDIDDEYDLKEESIHQIDPKTFLVDPTLHLNDFNDYFSTDLEEIKNDSIGGFLIDKLGRLPKEGDFVTYRNIEIMAKKVDRYRLDILQVKFLK